MVFLVNTLRDIIKAAHRIILATTGSAGNTSGTPALSTGDKGRSRASTAAVVEYMPADDRIRVRPANASDGAAVAPF